MNFEAQKLTCVTANGELLPFYTQGVKYTDATIMGRRVIVARKAIKIIG